MNALGLILVGSVVHATGFALLGSLFYLGLRRWSPAAGALAAGSSLVIMSLVSIVVLSPWPEWWIVAWAEPGREPLTVAREAEPSETAPITTPAQTQTERGAIDSDNPSRIERRQRRLYLDSPISLTSCVDRNWTRCKGAGTGGIGSWWDSSPVSAWV